MSRLPSDVRRSAGLYIPLLVNAVNWMHSFMTGHRSWKPFEHHGVKD
jgi:hypothetical protein